MDARPSGPTAQIDRMVRSCEFQINFCKETLDPDVKRYRVQLKDLHERRVNVTANLEDYQVFCNAV